MENQNIAISFFKYACMIDSIDEFFGCMDVTDFATNMYKQNMASGFADTLVKAFYSGYAVAMNVDVACKTIELCGERPDRVLFFGIPAYSEKRFMPCAIAQVFEQNKTYLFTSDFDFAAMYVDDDEEVNEW